jgi:uncharacterized protein YoxC
MNLPSDTPKLPKWIFLIGDLALCATAWFIYDGSAHPLAATPLIAMVACVVVATFFGAIPFFAGYAHSQDEALDNRQRALHALSVTVAAAAEQVSIAATGLNGIAEAAQENFSKSERLAHDIQEKIAELDTRLAAAKKGDAEVAARLESIGKAMAELDGRLLAAAKNDADAAVKFEAVAKKIGKAAAEFDAAVSKASEAAKAIPAAPVHIPEVPPVIASRMVEIKPAVMTSNPPYEAPVEAPRPAPASEAPSAAPPEPAPAPEAAATPVEPAPAPAAPPAAAAPADPAPADPAPPPPRKRSPRKPAAPPPAAPAVAELVLESTPAAEVSPAAEAHAEPAVSSDGATRLLITAYIGIGNRLFVRGDGPGLSWEKGVPLNFVSIGKWRWETNDASKPVAFKLYKNDEIECSALGERSVAPGAQLELTASF